MKRWQGSDAPADPAGAAAMNEIGAAVDPDPVDAATEMQVGMRSPLTGLVRAAILTTAFCIVVASLHAAQTVLAPLVAAMFFGLVVTTPIPWLVLRMPRWAAIAIVAGVTAGFVGGIVVMIPFWAMRLSSIVESHGAAIDAVTATVREAMPLFGVDTTDRPDGGLIPAQWLLSAGASAFRIASGTVFVMVLVGFVVAEIAGFRTKLRAAFGEESRRVEVVDRTAGRLIGYFRIKTLASVTTGLLVAVSCLAVGLELPVLWGLIAFLLNYAPTIGSFVAAVPAVLLAALTLGWVSAAVLAGAYLVINTAIGTIIEPRLLGERMGLSPLVVLMSLMIWGWIWGPIGLLLAVPLTMVFKIVLEQSDDLRPVAVLLGSITEARATVGRRAVSPSIPIPREDP
jgi:predicted PurR-regulated permease PerM